MCQVPAIPESVSFRVSSSPTFLRLSSITGLCRPRIRTSPDTVPGVLSIPGCGGPALAVCCCRRSGLGLFLAGTFCKSEGCSLQASLSLLIEAFLPSLSLSYANGSSPTAPRFSPGSNSVFIKTGSVASGRQLRISFWTGKPLEHL